MYSRVHSWQQGYTITGKQFLLGQLVVRRQELKCFDSPSAEALLVDLEERVSSIVVTVDGDIDCSNQSTCHCNALLCVVQLD